MFHNVGSNINWTLLKRQIKESLLFDATIYRLLISSYLLMCDNIKALFTVSKWGIVWAWYFLIQRRHPPRRSLCVWRPWQWRLREPLRSTSASHRRRNACTTWRAASYRRDSGSKWTGSTKHEKIKARLHVPSTFRHRFCERHRWSFWRYV